MDPIADYLAAAYPEPVTLLGQRLRPFSLGHMELLSRFRNAYVTNGPAPALDDLAFAVFVCCQGWQEALAGLEAPDLKRKLTAWGNLVPAFSFEEKSAAFVSYLLAGASKPEVIQTQPPGGESTGLSLLHDVRLTLCGKLGYSRAEAMDCPWGLALWDYYGSHAQAGNLRVVGDELAEQVAWARETNRRIAAGEVFG